MRSMVRRPVHAQRLAALFALGWLLFSYPLLALFDRSGMVFGIPRLVAWLFGAWAALIVAAAILMRGRPT